MPLSDVLFQPKAQVRLQQAMHAGRIPHAYLFAGPEGIGKELLAHRLATILLCENPVEGAPPKEYASLPGPWRDACGRCVECELSAAGNHPDIHRIHRGLTRYHPEKRVQRQKPVDLTIDVVRHFVIESMGLRPSRGRAKVFIIAEADRLNQSSQNALLKTLEEPPEHSYIILISSSGDLLLETTRSRCHLVNFQPLPLDFIKDRLIADRGLNKESAGFLAELSGGSMGIALRHEALGLHGHAEVVAQMLAAAPGDPLGFGKRIADMSKELAKELAKRARAAVASAGPTPQEADEVADDEEEDGEDDGEPVELELGTNVLREARVLLLAIVATLLRDVQRRKLGREPRATPSMQFSHQLASATTTAGVRRAIRGVAAAEYQMERNVNASLLFDVLGVEVGRGLAGEVR